ncbi:ABC transporter ATP-binding protein [Pseudolysinimonas kribbensis]|uniref:ABC transporter ATP-binding protein n=2 Tax=Pseudolysinimonas kribbensis TaxID=433641 RepID=A0ABQ6K5I7_9MICO|nr:ABC transporter ATP-binding protein [Pseudolysinimonas kribbensis]GMA95880.1 ABC transporter ATP-binding protein [Pseudolysinimonas kribbensis]
MAPSSAPAPALVARADGSALRLDGVTRRFGGLVAVDGVSLVLPPGGRLAVIGPNGAGKTTLFRLIAGEFRPTSGRVHLFGEDVTRTSERARARRGISRTFQVSTLFEQLTVIENVLLAAQAGSATSRSFWSRTPLRGAHAGRAADMLERVGLAARAGVRVAELSHGEHRQLELAAALIHGPRLLLLDEPAAGLSAGERDMLRILLGEIPDSVGVVLIEHDMTLALEFAREVLCLDNGVPLAYGTPEEIRANPAVQAVYLGRRD